MPDDPAVEEKTDRANIRENFDRLLLRLDADPAKAAEIYERIRYMLARLFECNHCIDPDELANEALSVVAKKLESEDILKIDAYAYGVARKMLPRCRKKAKSEISTEELRGEITDCENLESEIIDKIDSSVWLECLRRCLTKLDREDRKLVVLYYSAESHNQIDLRRRLAEMAGQADGTFKTRIFRIRKWLETCVNKRLTEHNRRNRDFRNRRRIQM